MNINFRTYRNDERFGEDFHKVCDFLIRLNEKQVIKPNFLWARWVWMISRPVDNEEERNLIGIWEDAGRIVALATFELTFGELHICYEEHYSFLLPEVLAYAEQSLTANRQLKMLTADDDRDFQRLALQNGYFPTLGKEAVSVLDVAAKLNYHLPEGFSIVSMADNWDFHQYNRVMWRGFGHEGEPSQEKEDIDWRKTMLSSPQLLPELVIAVTAPNGNYASHCGLWYMPGTAYAYVEPVATDPIYRNLGLAKAALYECINRAAKSGTEEVYVCSDQQFYLNIGFYPVVPETWWQKKLPN